MPDERIAYLMTPLPPGRDGEDALLFARMTGTERISRCFEYEVYAQSYDPDISATDLLGVAITVTVPPIANAGEDRHFHGIVDEFSFEGNDEEGLFVYRLLLRPTLWLLSKRTNNRIFQEMSVKDIVDAVLGENGITDLRFDLGGSALDLREYCVQYGESDLDFMQRLLEHEGAWYHFDFEEDKHTLVIGSNKDSLEAQSDVPELRFEPNDLAMFEGEGIITRLQRRDTVVTGKHVLKDYDFESPSSDLLSAADNAQPHANADREQYQYPGYFKSVGRGDDIAEVRVHQDQSTVHQIRARSNAVRPWVGRKVTLFDHPREAENQDYILTEIRYEVVDAQYVAGVSREDLPGIISEYVMVPSEAPFRPRCDFPRPVMRGPQTAQVVGPGGEEIYTDEYARVKVRFFWDRDAANAENDSCWIRVSSAWAGAGYGFIQIPRIGQEVIVDFLDGDPDRPIITGRVYNAEQMPPYDLPANATQSGWKSESSKGGGGFNELRFEDLKGSEEVYFQAEKDHNELVKNNESRHIGNDFAEEVVNNAKQDVGVNRDETVGNNKTTSVGVDRTVDIGNNDTETVGVNRSLTVGTDESISVGNNSTESIGANHTQTVGANQTITVSVARTDTVGAVETRTVGAAQINSIGAVRQMTVGASQSHDIAATDTWDIGATQSISIGADQISQIASNHSVTIGKDSTQAIGKNLGITVGEDMSVEIGKNLVVTAADSITFTCGDANFQMKKDGTIVMEGKDITIIGSGKINAKASGEMTLKGSKINQN